MPPAVRLRGLKETHRAFQRVEKDAGRDLRGKLRDAAKPVAADAEHNVTAAIKTITPPWAKMRVGVTSTLVYIAPKQKGVGRRGDSEKRRPNLADLMAPPMEEALAENEKHIVRTVDDILTEMERDWGRGR